MTTYREAIYMCLDLLKALNDDFTYTEEHVAYLLDKYRALLLKQRYSKDPLKEIPYSNYQTIEMDLGLYATEANKYYICSPKIPYTLQIGIPRISIAEDHYGDINLEYVSRERLPYTCNNRFIQNFWYCSLDDRNNLCLKASSIRLLDKTEVSEDAPTIKFRITALFENPRDLDNEVSFDSLSDWKDRNIPIEESLITSLIDMVVKELAGSMYVPNDSKNNASDDKADIASYINRNMKSDFTKQIQ